MKQTTLQVRHWLVLVILAVFAVQALVVWLTDTSVMFEWFSANSEHPYSVWTWILAVFSHGGITHLCFNCAGLLLMSQPAEYILGRKRFLAFFVTVGALSILFEFGLHVLEGTPVAVLGASGAIMGCVGFAVAMLPKGRALLFFVIPMSLEVFALYILVTTAYFVARGQVGVAHGAHVMGFALGYFYAKRFKWLMHHSPSLREEFFLRFRHEETVVAS